MLNLSVALYLTDPLRLKSLSNLLDQIGVQVSSESPIALIDETTQAADLHHESLRALIVLEKVSTNIPPNLVADKLSLPLSASLLHNTLEQRHMTLSATDSAGYLTLSHTLSLFMQPPALHHQNGWQVALTTPLAQMLRLLVERGKAGVSKETFVELLWPQWQPSAETHSFDSQLYRLRQKLTEASEGNIEIRLEQGHYRLHDVTLGS